MTTVTLQENCPRCEYPHSTKANTTCSVCGEGYGAYCFTFTNGLKRIGVIEKMLNKTELTLLENWFTCNMYRPDIDPKQCYLTAWDGEKLISLYGNPATIVS